MKQHLHSIILVISILIHLTFSLGAVNNSLYGWHEYRKTQTALTVKYFAKEGISLDYKTPIVGSPWKVPMEFPTYQAIVYWVHSIFNGNLEAEGRIVSLIFFYLSLFIIYRFLARLNITSKNNIKLIIASIVLSNYYLYWGGVFLIEATALFFSIWYAYLLYINLIEKERTKITGWVFILLIGLLGMLTKVTAFIPIAFTILVAIGLHILSKNSFAITFKKMLIPCITFLICVIVQYWWVSYADGIKAENPIAAEWVSSAIRSWNFGTLEQRLTPSLWAHYFNGLGHYILPLYALVFLIAVYNSFRNRNILRFNMVVLGIFFSAPLLFFNLYKVHTYYSIATNLFFIIFMFFNILELKNTVADKLIAPKLKIAGIGLLFLGIIALFGYRIYHVGYSDKYFTSKTENNPYNEFAEYIGKHTNENAYVIICGNKLNSNITYHIDRKSINTSIEYIDDDATKEMLLKRNGATDFNGIICLQNDTTLKESVATLWEVNPQPAYKLKLQDKSGLLPDWLCYYKN